MRRLLLALAFLVLMPGAQAQGPIVGPGQTILCSNPLRGGVPSGGFVGTAALAQIQGMGGIAGQSIYICGWHITNSAASGTFAFSYGTGTNCGTGTTVLIPPVNVSSSAPATDHIDYAFIQIPAGNSLCQNSTATVSGAVWFNQF